MRLIEKSVFTSRYKIFLQRLREAREASGLTQTELAEKLNPTSQLSPDEAQRQLLQGQRYVSRCETGERRVDVTELWVFCQALGISFTEFAQMLDESLQTDKLGR